VSKAADQRFMQLALTLAARQGRTWPNPAVGAVVVKDGLLWAGVDAARRPPARRA